MKVNFFGDICLDGIDWQRFEFDPALRTLMEDAINIVPQSTAEASNRISSSARRL